MWVHELQKLLTYELSSTWELVQSLWNKSWYVLLAVINYFTAAMEKYGKVKEHPFLKAGHNCATLLDLLHDSSNGLGMRLCSSSTIA